MIDWSKFNLAKQAFQTCETDGEEGLTWDEVDACEVRAYNIPSSACSRDLRLRDWSCLGTIFVVSVLPNI